MTGGKDGDASQADQGVSLEAHVSGNARAYQAGRDLHIRYEADGLATRKVRVADVVEECPYPGLAAFGPDDAPWFFGRDALLAELTDILSEQPPGQGPVMLVACSGAGKSSLLQAGLMPALDDGVLPQAGSRRWPRLLFTPTAHPLTALIGQLSPAIRTSPERVSAALAEGPEHAADLVNRAVSMGHVPGNGVAVIIDQFEETFTLCDDETERRIFVETLCAMGAAANPSGSLVVVSLRADFYQHACAYPKLRAALRDRQLLMGPMSSAELRQAIVGPSQAVGLELEPGLVELLIRDLGGKGGNGSGPADVHSYEAGRLPLLAHALRATWQQRHGHVLTVDGYMATGGIPHAIAASAERTFGRLDDGEQELARLLFLRLVRIGDRTEDTRRRVAHSELVQDSGSPPVAEAVIGAFTRARLLTHERESVEITHEALLREWPRLRGWIDTDHAGRLVLQDIEEQAARWEVAGRDAARLYRGAQLAAAATWAASSASRSELTSRARAFLAASSRQKRRATLLRRGVIAALAVLVLVASGLAATAFVQDRAAIRARDQAVFNEISSKAASLSSTNPSLAAEFDLAAYRMNPTPNLYTSLINTEATSLATPLGAVPAPLPTFSSTITFGSGGQILAGAGGQTIRLWNTTDPERPTLLGSLPKVASTVVSVSISPDTHTLAAGLSNGTVQMWNIAAPARPDRIGKPLHIPLATAGVEAAFDPRGQVLLAWFNQGHIGVLQLWDVSQPAKPKWLSFLVPCTRAAMDSMALSSDGNSAAIGCSDGKVHLANITDLKRPQVQGWMQASSNNPVNSLAFSADGRTLVSAAYNDQTFSLWNVADPRHPASLGSPIDWLNNGVYSASFSPDGPVVATTDHDGTVQLWNVANPAEVSDLGPALAAGAGPALDVAFSPDGQRVAADYADGTMRLWTIPHPLVTANGFGQTDGLAFSTDGHLLASSNNQSNTLDLWEINGHSQPRRAGAAAVCATRKIQGTELIAFIPQRPILAAGCDGGLRLWDVADPFHITALSPWLAAPGNSWVNSVAFDHRGKVLAAAGNGYVTLWNVADPTHPTKLGSLNTRSTGYWTVASISPDGRTLAVGAGTTVRLWNITNPAEPRLIAGPLPGPTQWITYITFSHNGDMLAAGSADDNIYLWNTAGPHPGTSFSTLTGHTDLVTYVAFSANDRTLASSSYDDTVRLWNTAPAGPFGDPLTGHTDYALAVAFSPVSNTLASIGNDDTVYLWDMNVRDAISRICAATVGMLTPSQWHRDLPGVPYSPPCPAR
jgi:WD40 repeat protein